MDLTQWQILECLQCQKNFIEINSDEEVGQQSICQECLEKLTSQDKKILLQTQYLEKQVNFLRAFVQQQAQKEQTYTQITDINDNKQIGLDLELLQMNKQMNKISARQVQLDEQRHKLLEQLRQLQIQEENGLNEIQRQQIKIVKIAESIEYLKQESSQLQDYWKELRNTSILSEIFEITFDNQSNQINGEVIGCTNIYLMKQILDQLFFTVNYKPKIISIQNISNTGKSQQQLTLKINQKYEIMNLVNNIIQELFHFLQFIKIKYQRIQAKGLTKFDLPYQIILQPKLLINKTNFECESNLDIILKYLLTNIKYLISLNFNILDEEISQT